MTHLPSVVEQALALARTGVPLTRIIRKLKLDGHLDVPAQLDGMAIRRKIRDLNRQCLPDRNAPAADEKEKPRQTG